MSQEKHTAVDLLKKMGDTVLRIEQNLQQNRLDRKSFRRLLNEYLLRAESDGRLMNAARQEPHCDNRGVFLAYTHMELITWLSKNNYTLLSTSVGWYSWRQFLSKYRIPPFWDSEKAKDLKSQLHHIKRIAALVYADLQAYHISIPETAIQYPSVPVGEPAAPPAEAYEDLFHRGSLAQKALEGSAPA